MISTRTLFPAARNEKEMSLFVSSIKLKRNFSADIILSTAEKHELLVSCRSLELEIGVSQTKFERSKNRSVRKKEKNEFSERVTNRQKGTGFQNSKRNDS
jgi:elongation factor P hydroxylase